MNPDARLRRALDLVDPPEGFAQRVRARVVLTSGTALPAPRRRLSRGVAIAATVLAVLVGPFAYREYETRRDALAARAQIVLALQIASRELNSAHRKVVRPVAPTRAPAGVSDSGREGRP